MLDGGATPVDFYAQCPGQKNLTDPSLSVSCTAADGALLNILHTHSPSGH